MLERDEVLSWRLECWDSDRPDYKHSIGMLKLANATLLCPVLRAGYYCQTNDVATDVGLDMPPTTNQPTTTCLASVDGFAVGTVSALRETDRPPAKRKVLQLRQFDVETKLQFSRDVSTKYLHRSQSLWTG